MSDYFVESKGDSAMEAFPGVDLRLVSGQQIMISVVNLKPYAEVAMHSHPHEQMGMLLEGELDFTVGNERRTVTAGEFWRIPGGVMHGCVAGDQPAKAIDIFHPPREDYQ